MKTVAVNLCRFIPAYAGNSEAVHGVLRLGHGSSPLTRGTPADCLMLVGDTRFIPAYAGNSRRRRPSLRSLSVHPRLRGELTTLAGLGNPTSGSSPLTRGTPNLSDRNHDYSRFIPAYAGNSSLLLLRGGVLEVHPRLRGELSADSVSNSLCLGSSPLTRGTHLKTV